MFVKVNKGIDEFQIDLKQLSCLSCHVTYSKEPISRLSWMCPHIALAIAENEYEFEKHHPLFKPYVPIIKQHAHSNSDSFLPDISSIYHCNDVTLFLSSFDLESRSHEFLRAALNNMVYTLWLPGFEWCFNGGQLINPLSESDKSRVERHIFEKINTGLFYDLNKIVLINPEVTDSRKIGNSGLKFVGASDTGASDYQVTVIYKKSSQKVRLNMKISGWHRIKGSSVAYYDVEKNSLELKHRALTVFEIPLLKWCDEITNHFNRIYELSK